MNTLRYLIQAAFVIVAILLAAAGQYLHTFYYIDLLALAFFIIALVVWIVALASSRVSIDAKFDEATYASGQTRPISKPLVASAVALALLTLFFSSGNQFSLDNLIAWTGSVVAILYIFWEPGTVDWPARLREHLAHSPAMLTRAALLAAILLIGAVFYFYNFDDPSQANSHHDAKVNAVNAVLKSNDAPIFFDYVPGGEPLEIYLAAWCAKVFNLNVDPLLLEHITMLSGWLLISLTFLLARELFGTDSALIAAFLIAISKWNVTMARMGLQFVFAPIFIALVMLFLVRGFKHERRNDFLLAGFFLGAGVYGYSAFRIAPFLVLTLVVLWFLRVLFQPERAQIGRSVVNSILMFIVALVVAMPLLRFATEQPKQIATPIVYLIGNDATNVGNPVAPFASNLVGAATMFNWTGDANRLNAVSNDPALDYVTGALFLLGVVFALYRTIRHRESIYVILLLGLTTLVLPSALSIAHPLENPSIVRAAGAIPFVFIIAALPIAWLLQFIKTSNATLGRIVVMVVLLFLLVVSIRANFLRYYHDYAPTFRQESWNESIVDFSNVHYLQIENHKS